MVATDKGKTGLELCDLGRVTFLDMSGGRLIGSDLRSHRPSDVLREENKKGFSPEQGDGVGGEHWPGRGSDSDREAERVRESKGCAKRRFSLYQKLTE